MKQRKKIRLHSREDRKKSILLAISMAAGLILFIILLQSEQAALSAYQTRSVLLAAKDIPQKTVITQENLKEYFKEQQVNVNCAVDAFADWDELSEMIRRQGNVIVSRKIRKNEQIFKDKFSDRADYVALLAQPVEVGIKVHSYEYSVGGTLREGDYVDLSVINLDNESEVLFEHVLILKAFDSSGREIAATDQQAVSIGFNILLDKQELERYQTVLEQGNVRLTRNYYDVDD